MQNSVVNKPVEANKIIYIIKNADKLNSSSANSILKFLEEPADDIIAILLTDNVNIVIPTIKSRCQVLNFNSVRNNKKIENLISDNIKIEEDEIQNLINASIEFINSIENKKINTFIYSKSLLWDKYKTNDEILILFNFMTYAYIDSMHVKLGKEIKYMDKYPQLIEIINKNNNIDGIIAKVNIIEKIKNDLKMNVNIKLLFDKLIIELSEV